MSISFTDPQLFPPLPSLLPFSTLGLSEENKKVYQLVVGKIIPAISAGLFISCAVLSFVATPVYALGAVGAFFVGLFGIAAAYEQQSLEEVQAPQLPAFIPNQPIGIRNGGNNCWANSVLQIVMNNPELERKFASRQAFRNIFLQYKLARAAQTSISTSLTGREVREHLVAEGVSVGAGPSQEDAGIVFEEMLGISNTPSFYTFMQSVGGMAFRTMYEPMISLALAAGSSFEQLFDSYFDCMDDEGSHLIKKFESAPQTLVVQMKRFTHQQTSQGSIVSVKNNQACDVPLEITLTPDKTVDERGARYECNGFIQHLGYSLNGGHYIAYIKRGGEWWYCSDSYVRQASIDTVEAAIKRSYIVTYSKVESSSDSDN